MQFLAKFAGQTATCSQCRNKLLIPPLPKPKPSLAPKEEILDVNLVENVPVLPLPEVEVPPRRDRQRSRCRRNGDQAEQDGKKEQRRSRNLFVSIMAGAPAGGLVGTAVGGIVGLIGFGFVGLILSQYWPVFGGFLELNLAQPWSQARMNLIPIHLFVFGITGLVLGAVAGFLLGLLLGAGVGSFIGYEAK